MMKLLKCQSFIHIQKRFSRNSVIDYRKRRALLKEFRVQKQIETGEENIYAKLDSPLQRLVPVQSHKTSLTIDILGEETYPQLSEWRRQSILRRARRVLPLPISLTTDDKIGRTWHQKYLNSIKPNSSVKDDELLDEVPNFVRLIREKDPEVLKISFPEIREKYQRLLEFSAKHVENSNDSNSTTTTTTSVAPYFPFMSTLQKNEHDSDQMTVNIEEEEQNKILLDDEYDNYLKHHQLLQHFASNLQSVPTREYSPEIEGWASQLWLRNYGKPDPTVPPSKVPCSGCGAHLHCVANNVPGFMPSEKFTLFSEAELHNQLCQRCLFLKQYNVALNVNVPVDEYAQLISKIQLNKSLVILLVDLLDFPCSVWPGIVNLIGEKHRIYLVGNKVDLLPKDDKLYLERIKKSLKESLKSAGITRETKIRDVSLISAKTGYGVENLVTKLLRDIRLGENIYLIGCTNSGKSTLFNALMQSDLCALRDADLMTRATTSLWPGTTLNLLKFPVQKLAGWQLQMRLHRLNLFEKQDIAERRLTWTMHRQSSNPQIALLSERVTPTFRSKAPVKMDEDHPLAKKDYETRSPFKLKEVSSNVSNLHDTPGVIYKDQLLSLLTIEELLRTVPREIITPRTYTIQPSQTIFIGGLARIDLVHARQHVWLTVFASRYLPVHIVYTEEAKRFYQHYLGTDTLAVPMGGEERLRQWPHLLPKEFTLHTVGWEESCADLVLSNAGWVSVTSGPETECVLRSYTPEGRGLFMRKPSMLPYAIRLRGKRIPNTPCYENKLFTIDDLTTGSIPRKFTRYSKSDHITQERLDKTMHFVQGHN